MHDLIFFGGRRHGLLASLAVLTVSCSGGDGGGNDVPPEVSQVATSGSSLVRDVQPIFNDNCAICHQSGSAQAGLNLEAGKSFANIVGVKSRESPLNLVRPDDPEQSYLFLKLTGKHLVVGGSGAAMPMGDALTPAQIDQVKRWIRDGAPDN